MKVLLTGAAWQPALASLRNLGEAGARVDVIGGRLEQCLHSRYCCNRLFYSDPKKSPEKYLEQLYALVSQERYDALLPCDEHSAVLLSGQLERFQRFIPLPVPSSTRMTAARDKAQLLKIAQKLGLDVPQSFQPSGSEDLKRLSQKVTYPCVIKPRRSMAAVGLRYADSPEALLELYAANPQPTDPHFDFSNPLVQEFIPGQIHDVCALFNHGEPRAVLTQKRLFMYPARGGRGIECETTREPQIEEKAITLLRQLRWHGPAQVEFKHDPRDGVFKLMEINPRFWGTLELSICAGIPFPLLTCQMLMKGDIEPVSDYKVGLRFRWLIPYILPRFFQSKRKLRFLLYLVRRERRVLNEVRITDPLPHLVHPIYLLSRKMASAHRRFWESI